MNSLVCLAQQHVLIYLSYQRSAYLFWMKKRIEKRENLTSVCLMSGLTKEAWDGCEAINMERLDQSTELTKLFAILDQHFKYDERTEIPNLFEKLFAPTWRQNDQTLIEYVTTVDQRFRQLRELEVEHPSFNIEECDECHVNYIEARRHMNTLRMSSGVFPMCCSGRHLSALHVQRPWRTASPRRHDDHRKDVEKEQVDPEAAPAKKNKIWQKNCFTVTETVSVALHSLSEMW